MIWSRFHTVSIPHYPISPDVHHWFKPQRLFTVTSVTFFYSFPICMCFSLTHVSESPFRKWGLSVPHSSPTVATCPFWVMLTKHWLSSPRSPVHGLFQSFHGSGTSSLLLLDCWCLTALMNGESRSSVSGFIWSAVTAGQCVYLLSRTGVCNNTLYLVLLRLWLCSKWNTYCVKLHTACCICFACLKPLAAMHFDSNFNFCQSSQKS